METVPGPSVPGQPREVLQPPRRYKTEEPPAPLPDSEPAPAAQHRHFNYRGAISVKSISSSLGSCRREGKKINKKSYLESKFTGDQLPHFSLLAALQEGPGISGGAENPKRHRGAAPAPRAALTPVNVTDHPARQREEKAS